MIRKYLDSLFFRTGKVENNNPLNRFERFIHTIDYWLLPFRVVDKWTIKSLYDTYSELFLINSKPIGKYKNIIKEQI